MKTEEVQEKLNVKGFFNKFNILIILGVLLVIAIIIIVVITIINLPIFTNLSASKVFPQMLKTMGNVKTLQTTTTLTVQSDDVPELSDQPLNFTTKITGIVDKSTPNNLSSGNFDINIGVQGTSFKLSGNYAADNTKLYYDIQNVSQNFPINFAPIENKWIYNLNDNSSINKIVALFFNKSNENGLDYTGINTINGHMTYTYQASLSKDELQAILKNQANAFSESILSKDFFNNLNSIVNGMQSSSVTYYIGTTDNHLYRIHFVISSNTTNSSKKVSHTTYTLNIDMSKFNSSSNKVTIPTNSTSLSNAL